MPRVGVLGFVILLLLTAVCPIWAAQDSEGPVLNWLKGPTRARLGDHALLTLPQGYAILGPDDARAILAQMGNVPSGEEVALVAPLSEEEHWFVVIRYMRTGYVPDEEAGSWDARAIMAAIKNGAETANRTRAAMGIPLLHVTGWEEQPRYEMTEHKVTWAIAYEDKDGMGVNYHTLALGRYGYISTNMVGDLDLLPHLMNHSRTLLANLNFVPGSRYQDFDPRTDPVAAVGLTAVIAGGGFKPGLLATFRDTFVAGPAETHVIALTLLVLAGLATRLHRRKPASPLEA